MGPEQSSRFETQRKLHHLWLRHVRKARAKLARRGIKIIMFWAASQY